METQLRVQVRPADVDAAIEELTAGIREQHSAYVERLERLFPMRAKRLVRSVALVLCVVGGALCLVMMWVPENRLAGVTYLGAMLLLGLAFYHIFAVEDWVRERTVRFARSRLRRRAERDLGRLRAQAPLDIVYTLRSDTVQGQWLTGEGPHRAWKRPLGRFALVGSKMCALFGRQKDVYPRVILMHTDPEQMLAQLTALGVEARPFQR